MYLGTRGIGIRVWGSTCVKGAPMQFLFGSAMAFVVRKCDILFKKELQRRVWVGFTLQRSLRRLMQTIYTTVGIAAIPNNPTKRKVARALGFESLDVCLRCWGWVRCPG